MKYTVVDNDDDDWRINSKPMTQTRADDWSEQIDGVLEQVRWSAWPARPLAAMAFVSHSSIDRYFARSMSAPASSQRPTPTNDDLAVFIISQHATQHW